MNKQKIKNVIIESISEINNQLPDKIDINAPGTVHLYGGNGKLDSLGLVNLLVAIEQNLEDKFDINVTIADEKAMSQKSSPFKTVNTLLEYLNKIIK